MAKPDPFPADHPPGLLVELREGGRPIGETTSIGTLDNENTLRFEARRGGTERIIIVTERRRPHVVWFAYDPTTGQGWPASRYEPEVRKRLIDLIRACRHDNYVFSDEAK